MSNDPSPNRYVPQLDEMLTPDECVAWLKADKLKEPKRWLAENVKTIVPFKPSRKVTLYHPRTILATMAFNAGVPLPKYHLGELWDH